MSEIDLNTPIWKVAEPRVEPSYFPFRVQKIPLLAVSNHRWCSAIKRGMDLLICIVAMPFALLLMALCAVAIVLDSPGAPFFVQERVGLRGRRFRIYKLRTMHCDLDKSYHEAFMRAFVRGEVGAGTREEEVSLPAAFVGTFVDSVPDCAVGNGRVFKPIQPSQLTRVGKILRRTSLDELPQIWNVLKGEMSIVGPRPNVPWEVEEYRPWHYGRLQVLPGITGLAQIKGRSGLAFDRIVEYDIEYVERQSILLDCKIIYLTVAEVLRGVGAR